MERIQSIRRYVGTREELELFGTHRQVYAESGKSQNSGNARTQGKSGAYQTVHIIDMRSWQEIVKT